MSFICFLSLCPSESTTNEFYPFPLARFDLFEENMLEDNFCSSNDQNHDCPLSIETVGENISSQELLLIEPILDDYKCDLTQMVLIYPYEVYLEKIIGENHQVNNNSFVVLCEGSGQPLELDLNLDSGESPSFSSKSFLQFLPKFSSSSCYSNSHFLPIFF